MSGLIVGLLFSLVQETVPPRLVSIEPSTERTIFADFIGLSGRVVLDCDLLPTGILENCVVQDAVPTDAGFERLALANSSHLRYSPQLEGGKPIGTDVTVPFVFKARPSFDPYVGAEPSQDAIAALKPLARFIVAGGGSGRIVADLPEDRRAKVQAWIDELLPIDPEAEVVRIAKRYARTLTTEQIEAIAARRQPPGELPDFETLNSADFLDPAMEAAADELKRRYCAEYDCHNPFAEAALSPAS